MNCKPPLVLVGQLVASLVVLQVDLPEASLDFQQEVAQADSLVHLVASQVGIQVLVAFQDHLNKVDILRKGVIRLSKVALLPNKVDIHRNKEDTLSNKVQPQPKLKLVLALSALDWLVSEEVWKPPLITCTLNTSKPNNLPNKADTLNNKGASRLNKVVILPNKAVTLNNNLNKVDSEVSLTLSDVNNRRTIVN